VNPQLALAADGVWRPGQASPAINTGQGTYPFVTTDMDGQARDAMPDVGADEIAQGAVTHRPLTPADVGPPKAMIVSHAAEMGHESRVVRTSSLGVNYPNPFNPSTTITYSIAEGTTDSASLRVYDLLGREVAVLVNEQKPAGSYSVQWNAAACAGGCYYARLESDGRVHVHKLLLLK